MYGWIVTYEDPRYEHDSEIMDVTESTRNDGRLDRRVLVPRGGPFSVEIARPSPQATLADISRSLTAILEAHQASGNAGVFRLNNTGDTFHVSPAAVKARDGRLVPQTSILDVSVSLAPRKDRTVGQAVREVLAAVSQANGQTIGMGMVPTNRLVTSSFQEGAPKQSARELLLRLLSSTGAGLSWQLFYNPSDRNYLFNIHVVRNAP
jgi:hypothetical protein